MKLLNSGFFNDKPMYHLHDEDDFKVVATIAYSRDKGEWIFKHNKNFDKLYSLAELRAIAVLMQEVVTTGEIKEQPK